MLDNFKFEVRLLFHDSELTDPVILPTEYITGEMILGPDGTIVWSDSDTSGGLASIAPADFDENGHKITEQA